MITYLSWWYIQEPIVILNAIKVATLRTFDMFSISLLLKTLFDPWKRDSHYVDNASLDVILNVWLSNIVSRLIGAGVRFMTILAGLIFTILVFISMFCLFILWFLMPVLIVYLFISGANIIINA